MYLEPKAGTFEKRVVLSLTTTYLEALSIEDGEGRTTFDFMDNKKVNKDPNGTYNLIISTRILRRRIEKCLVDEGNHADVIYQKAYEEL